MKDPMTEILRIRIAEQHDEIEHLRKIIVEMLSTTERMQKDNIEMAFHSGSTRATMKHRAVASRCGMLLGELRKISRGEFPQ
jgi:hypothetical protein